MIRHTGGPDAAGAFTSALMKPGSSAATVHIFACHQENPCSTPGRRRILITTAAGSGTVFDASFIRKPYRVELFDRSRLQNSNQVFMTALFSKIRRYM